MKCVRLGCDSEQPAVDGYLFCRPCIHKYQLANAERWGDLSFQCRECGAASDLIVRRCLLGSGHTGAHDFADPYADAAPQERHRLASTLERIAVALERIADAPPWRLPLTMRALHARGKRWPMVGERVQHKDGRSGVVVEDRTREPVTDDNDILLTVRWDDGAGDCSAKVWDLNWDRKVEP